MLKGSPTLKGNERCFGLILQNILTDGKSLHQCYGGAECLDLIL